MKYLVIALLIGLATWSARADNDVSKVNGAVRVEAGQTVGDVSSVNGSVRVEDGVTAQDVETVNGSIHIGERSRVRSIETVNGGISVGDGTHAQSVESVNGTIKLGRQVQVAGDMTTVNGSTSAAQGAEVRGNVETVNGRIELDAARVGGQLRTRNGDVTVGANSHVSGDLVVEKVNRGWFNSNKRNPKIVIGPNAIVEGTLRFHREVDLYVSNTAKIGKVEGATPRRFSGSEPNEADMQVER
jgi:DUF4097 and DUF4098 domain-containing protein YvlB